MNRNILSTMEGILEVLKGHVQNDDKNRIIDIKRHIKPSGAVEPVCEFVKSALVNPINCGPEPVCLFEYKGQRYLLLDERFRKLLSEIGLELEDNEAIIQGAGMLAMANRSLSIKQGVTSLQVINECLGVEPEPYDSTNLTLEFSQIRNLFVPYCIIRIDDSRFQLSYFEDYNRLICYLLTEEKDVFTESSKVRIKNLLLLLSSRSIAGSILNGLQSSLAEYTYLQIYQCIEYLFRLNNCFVVSEMHDISLDKSIDIILSHEFKVSEVENLYQVLRENASESTIQGFLEVTPSNPESNSDIYRITANYIYKLRCNVAHLRYRQEDISTVDWEKCTAALVEIMYTVYQKLDAKIIQVCSSNGAWTPISV